MIETYQPRSIILAIQTLLACIAVGASGAVAFDGIQAVEGRSAAKAPSTSRVVQSLPAGSIATADPHSVLEARLILAHFYSLPSKGERRLITGQFIGHGDYLSLGEIDEIQKRAGQRVALISNDYGLAHTTSIKGNSALIAHWKAGGFVMVSHHALNPRTMAFGSVGSRDVAMEDVLNPETQTGKNWLADMKKVADGLGELQKAGVVVLWRPFHEMNKDHFWWGLRDRAWFKRLWRRQFDLFTKTYRLHNLLWVYSSYQASDAATYYPGDDVVDIVGMDAYETHLERIRGYDAMVALGKPFGFTEFGPAGGLIPFVPIPIIDKNTDYVKQLAYIKAHYPKAVFLHAWAGGWGFQQQKNMEAFMNDPWLVNRGQCKRPR